MILAFLDDLIRLGYTGDRTVASWPPATPAGAYLRDRLLPAWAAQDTWGRYFWDWVNPVQNCLTTPDAARYLLDHPGAVSQLALRRPQHAHPFPQPQQRRPRNRAATSIAVPGLIPRPASAAGARSGMRRSALLRR